jgi:hypothetical protein
MLPDILGFHIDEGIDLLVKSGINNSDISICEYYSPKEDKMGSDRRIVKTNEVSGKIILTVSYF